MESFSFILVYLFILLSNQPFAKKGFICFAIILNYSIVVVVWNEPINQIKIKISNPIMRDSFPA